MPFGEKEEEAHVLLKVQEMVLVQHNQVIMSKRSDPVLNE